MIKILVADDTEIGRKGLITLLSTTDDMKVIGEATTQLEPVRMVRELEPDIVLMDLSWFGNPEAGTTAIRQIRATAPQTKIVAITAYPQLLGDAQRAGADAAITKIAISHDSLIGMIRDLYSQKGDEYSVSSPDLMPLGSLSDREFEVLNLLKRGYSNREIQMELGIGLSTVKNHVRSILQKLDAKNRTEAADIARNAGL